jgi:two-component system sensor histidine kinase DegS
MGADAPSAGQVDQVGRGTAPGRAGSAEHAAVVMLQERERRRIGFDLHDGPAQSISAALLQLRLLEDSSGDELTSGLSAVREMLSTALAEMYELIDRLGNKALDHERLVEKIEACVNDAASRDGMDIDFSVEGIESDMSDSLQIAVFRIVQEALSNALRHSGASRVNVRLRLGDDEVVCRIEDDGRGFDVAVAGATRPGRERYGLLSMRERARLLDGTCVVESEPGAGTRVVLRIPVWRG